MRSLREITEDLYVQLAGNRVTFAAGVVGIASVSEMLVSGNLVSFPLVGGSASILAITKVGCGTTNYFRRTRDHIKEFNRLGLSFAEKLIKETENNSFIRYCQLQGTYLAARRYGQLEIFEKAKENVSNCVIPNF